MSDNDDRQRLLNEIIDLQNEVPSGGDAEARALLSHGSLSGAEIDAAVRRRGGHG